ncbi:hypothetical protein PTKIN_Ptkin06aG0080800 [Pterospermum kingtungense]
MRIRKRQVPLPFSSISPVPLSSDPNFNRSPVVQLPLQQHPPLATPRFDPHCPSDHPNHPIGQSLPTQGLDSSAFPETTAQTQGKELKNKENYSALKQGGGGREEERRGEAEKSNDTRKKSVVSVELGIGSLPQSGSSHQAAGRWGEGEKAFPLKKRRGSFERKENDDDNDTIIMAEKDNNKVMISTNKMKTKMNKKFAQQENEQEKERKDSGSTTVDHKNNVSSGAKKRGRGGALMEGSRCSRVNGRGWRCCQQTLVGYSLCEHHLGKGRLRSMTSVRSRSLASSNNAAKEEEKKPNNGHDQYQTLSIDSSSSSQQAKKTKRELLGENGNEEGKDQKPLMMTTKKRVKLGMVKARSISSLLGQNDNATAVTDDNN